MKSYYHSISMSRFTQFDFLYYLYIRQLQNCNKIEDKYLYIGQECLEIFSVFINNYYIHTLFFTTNPFPMATSKKPPKLLLPYYLETTQ